MRILHSFSALTELERPIHWAIGFFDGVHLGHQRVIHSADTPGAMRGAITFNPHPLALIRPEMMPRLLTPHAQQKYELLKNEGVEILLELPFTRELSKLTPHEFIASLCTACNTAGISVGDNWHFGKGGAGNADFLRQAARKFGFTAHVSSMLVLDGEVVCSTRIRALLQEGNISRVNQMLGHPFSVYGTIEHGQKLARKLGFPTANIALPSSAALPRAGVYIVTSCIRGKYCRGIANIGLRPTIDETIKITRLEAHFPNHQFGDLYGESIEVQLHEWIRPERKFDSLEELQYQIKRDLAELNQ